MYKQYDIIHKGHQIFTFINIIFFYRVLLIRLSIQAERLNSFIENMIKIIQEVISMQIDKKNENIFVLTAQILDF